MAKDSAKNFGKNFAARFRIKPGARVRLGKLDPGDRSAPRCFGDDPEIGVLSPEGGGTGQPRATPWD